MSGEHVRITTVTMTLLAVVGLILMAPVAVGDASTEDHSVAVTTDSSSDRADVMFPQTDDATCEGAPTMSQTSITSPEDRITSEQPGVVEANFRVDPTAPEDCEVMVDLEFSFSESGFQFGGGAEWDQATTDLVVATFEGLQPGEIRDIRTELHTNGAEPGDEVTVIADYEIWYEGDRENSIQQSGIRHTIEVQEPNEAPESAPDDGSGDETDPILDFLEDNLAIIGLILIAVIAVVGLVYREPFVQVITGKR